jgi:hypothetical protein
MKAPPAETTPLSSQQIAELSVARTRARKIRRAAGVAVFSGWSMVVFAGLTLVGALFGSVQAIVVGGALGLISLNELRGAAMLRRFDERAPRLLGFNQIALGVLIVAYSVWSLWSGLRMPPLASLGGSTGDPEMDAMISDLARVITISLYATLAVVGVVVPVLTALYYFSRAKLLRAFEAQTPSWVIQAMRAAA